MHKVEREVERLNSKYKWRRRGKGRSKRSKWSKSRTWRRWSKRARRDCGEGGAAG